MRIQPDEIKLQHFKKSTVGGYRTDEVSAFLDVLSDDYREIADENRRLNERVAELEKKLAEAQRADTPPLQVSESDAVVEEAQARAGRGWPAVQPGVDLGLYDGATLITIGPPRRGQIEQ